MVIVQVQRNKRQRLCSKDSTEENTTMKPADGFPDGWMLHERPRKSGNQTDRFWYSPAKHKLPSRVQANYFLGALQRSNGDESVAWNLYNREKKQRIEAKKTK